MPAPAGSVTERDAAIMPELIPATIFASLVGRTLRTLRNWDRDGITNPVVINRRRYYRRADISELLANGSDRTGPREGSRAKYLAPNEDDGT